MVEQLRQRGPVVLMAFAGAALVAVGLAGALGFARHGGVDRPAAAGGATQPTSARVDSSPGTGTGSGQLVGYPGTPEALAIPTLGVQALIVEKVAVQSSGPQRGLLTAPADPLRVGWYRYRNAGALLIVGHVGDTSTAGALAYIGSLATGTSFSVTYAHGKRTYRVVSVVHVGKGHLSRSLFSPSANGEVVLITCDYRSPFHIRHFADNVYVVGSPI